MFENIKEYKFFKVLKVFIKNYFSSDISLLASNLTYMMSLTIFPFLSILLGVLKIFGLDERLIQELNKFIPQNQDNIAYIINVTNNIIINAKGGILAGLGAIILIFSVAGMLDLLERTFNNIWNVKSDRNYISKLINYMSLVLIAPLLMIIIIGTNSIILDILFNIFGDISIIAKISVKLFNMVVSILFIMGMFIAIPNKRVNALPALIGSTITYIGLYLIFFIYKLLQSSINNYNVIYGSLAFIPIFLIWIKYVWTMILIGTQITYSIQTYREYFKETIELSISLKKKIGIYLMYILINKFENFEENMSLNDLKEYTKLSKNILQEAIKLLNENSLINEIITEKDIYYQINKNPDYISVEMLNDIVDGVKIEEDDILVNMPENIRKEYDDVISEIIFKNKKLIKDIGRY